ncbi:MAG: exo-1,3-beta-glucanase [Cirrosporium novae-zelandiae]|nr:MAG: exo-1,3-beta-glucanase [Cirrosporium novae-zelandiae]
MFSKTFISAVLASGVAFGSPLIRRDAFNWGQETVRGVNIGGWLVLEPWITPSIFEAQDGSVVDEYTLCQNVPTAPLILLEHWETFATFEDFQKIAAAGINTVRIPIGYWAFQKFNDPYIQGAQVFLDKALEWCRQTGLKAWVDLHGAPLSQNGFDNSGQKMDTPGWEGDDSVNETLAVIELIATKYASAQYQDVVVAIELLNEPLLVSLADADTGDVLKGFYDSGYELVRDVSDTPIMLHDAFKDADYWTGFLMPSDNDATHVIIDHHEYQVFTDEEVAMSADEHAEYVCSAASSYTSSDHWHVVGEWSAALTDCALYLNGYGIGARYDGTYPDSSYVASCSGINSISSWNSTYGDDVRRYIETQLDVFEEGTDGWVFWNFKTERQVAEWDFLALIDAGIFPQPLTDRKFPSTCS